jgi:UDP-N-acetyl-D-galactosamine dehydrogenase
MQSFTPSNPPIIAIIGLGYVGLPLALAFSEKYQVIGYDVDVARVEALLNGVDITLQASSLELQSKSQLHFTSELAAIAKATIYIVTVPTPVHADKTPDLGPLLAASAQIATVLKQGDVVTIIEGPFRGMDAIFKTYDGEKRAILLLNLLTKMTEAKFGLN